MAAGRDHLPYAAASTEAYFRTAAAILAMRPASAEPDMSAALLKRHYGLAGSIATLSSEVERTVEVNLSDGHRLILKTSTRPEAVDSFRFQSATMAGLQGAAGFVAPEVLRTSSGALMFEEEGVCGYLQTRIEGVPLHKAVPTPDLLFRTGSALARLDLALAQVNVPAAHRPVLWHVGCWSRLMELEQYLPPGSIADSVRVAMADYVEFVEPQISNVAWQVTHNDPSPFNMMTTAQGTGFIDFGDGCWSPRIQDLAIAASHAVTDPNLPLGGAEHLIAGYASVIAISALEARLLVGLMRARQSALILVNNWRSHLFPGDAQYIKKNVARAEHGLSILTPLGGASGEAAVQAAMSSSRCNAVSVRPTGRVAEPRIDQDTRSDRQQHMSTDLMPNRYRPGESDLPRRESELIARRDDVLGASYRLQYRRPVHFVRGEGMWLYDPDGRAYLDFYNNVPSLGHCHPEVIAAMAEQAGRISANTRYLEPKLVDYAERLVDTFPNELDRVVFTCTGSESNDLALRIARFASGNEGVIVSTYAYHGTSTATAAVSPNLGDAVKLSPFVRMVTLPGPAGVPEAQAADFFEAQIRSAIMDLNRRGIGVAALLIDSIFSSDGVWADPPGFIAGGATAVREAGGLVIADEVQPGFGRTGAHMWGFERHRTVPDLVTLGKPMGNGFPIGAVVGRRAPMEQFGATARYSNTFAGNTVGIATADAVLMILQRDQIPQKALAMSQRLRAGLEKIAKQRHGVRAIRNAGLFFGIDMGPEDTPAAGRRAMALDVVNAMRNDGVLISTTGANEDTLKVRPPLVCQAEHVDLFLASMEQALIKVVG